MLCVRLSHLQPTIPQLRGEGSWSLPPPTLRASLGWTSICMAPGVPHSHATPNPQWQQPTQGKGLCPGSGASWRAHLQRAVTVPQHPHTVTCGDPSDSRGLGGWLQALPRPGMGSGDTGKGPPPQAGSVQQSRWLSGRGLLRTWGRWEQRHRTLCQEARPASHQGTTFPSQSRKVPVSFSEREESTFSIPPTLASTVKGGCGAEGERQLEPKAWLRAALEQPGPGEGAARGQGESCQPWAEGPSREPRGWGHQAPRARAGGAAQAGMGQAGRSWSRLRAAAPSPPMENQHRGSEGPAMGKLLPFVILRPPCQFAPSQGGEQRRGRRAAGSPGTGTWSACSEQPVRRQGRDGGGRGRVAAGGHVQIPRLGQSRAGGGSSLGHKVLLHYPHVDA